MAYAHVAHQHCATPKCVGTFSIKYKIFKSCCYEVMQVCSFCGHEYDHRHGGCPACGAMTAEPLNDSTGLGSFSRDFGSRQIAFDGSLQRRIGFGGFGLGLGLGLLAVAAYPSYHHSYPYAYAYPYPYYVYPYPPSLYPVPYPYYPLA